MNAKKILVAIPTYKEAQNIIELIRQIKKNTKNLDILIINDKSEDKTLELINNLNDNRIKIIERPKKNGLGSAHVMSIIYSIKFNYNILITMDADFSHDPIYLPKIIEKADINNFVIGSRFVEGGKNNYTGFRKFLSFTANLVSKKILDIKLNEFTTYLRAYDVESLKKLPFNKLTAKGYSLGVKIIWLLNKMNINLIEIPIVMGNRNLGKSKIPRSQIFVSVFDLIVMKLNDLFNIKNINKSKISYKIDYKCNECSNDLMIYYNKNSYKCLNCNILNEIN
mgnify:FL=1